MSSYDHKTHAEIEADIARYAATAARRARQVFAMARIDANDLPATDIYDECRDHAYDVLVALNSGEMMVDLLLLDVTDAAASLIMGG